MLVDFQAEIKTIPSKKKTSKQTQSSHFTQKHYETRFCCEIMWLWWMYAQLNIHKIYDNLFVFLINNILETHAYIVLCLSFSIIIYNLLKKNIKLLQNRLTIKSNMCYTLHILKAYFFPYGFCLLTSFLF